MRESVLLRVLQGTADANIRFDDLRALLVDLGFSEPIRGSHHSLYAAGCRRDSEPSTVGLTGHQVKQVRRVILRYKLAEGVE